MDPHSSGIAAPAAGAVNRHTPGVPPSEDRANANYFTDGHRGYCWSRGFIGATMLLGADAPADVRSDRVRVPSPAAPEPTAGVGTARAEVSPATRGVAADPKAEVRDLALTLCLSIDGAIRLSQGKADRFPPIRRCAMRQILVVANQTLGGEALKEVVRERIGQGPCAFSIVVPIVPHNADEITNVAVDSRISGPSTAYEAARSQAVRRLSSAMQVLRELGASVDGETGAQDPVKAVGHALAVRTYDEIIVSTLPKTVSRWLHQDIPHRIQRKYKIPVTTVTARERIPT